MSEELLNQQGDVVTRRKGGTRRRRLTASPTRNRSLFILLAIFPNLARVTTCREAFARAWLRRDSFHAMWPCAILQAHHRARLG